MGADSIDLLVPDYTRRPPRSIPIRSIVNSAAMRYVTAFLAVGLALAIRMTFAEELKNVSPFRLFYASVMLAAAFGGFGAGILAVALSSFAAHQFFMAGEVDPLLKLILFSVEGSLISILAGLLHEARRRAEASEDALRRDQLLRERLERQILEVSDHERQMVVGDLHDGLGQHLTGIAFMTKVLTQKLQSRQAAEGPDAAKIADLVNQAIGWTRDLAQGLAPVELVRNGLPGALGELASRAREMFNIDCTFSGEAVELEEARAVHVYRIAQEAVTNSVKHGKARHVRIELGEDDGEFVITITDDGAGFKYDLSGVSTRGKRGLGLQMMTYRARMLGGSLSITTPSGGGTQLVCRIPAFYRASDTSEELPNEQ